MRHLVALRLLCASCLLVAGCAPPAFAQEAPAVHAPAGADPQFERNLELIVSLRNLSATYARRIEAARGEVCRLRKALGRPACPPAATRPSPTPFEAVTLRAQREEIARVRNSIAAQRRSLDGLTSLQARLEAEMARRPQ
jgi:hypothetical protein